MRDPDLVQRAERAAMALERAWGHWRVMHGLGSDPLPPVSSYVGYSLEEPWGQPRVVFGVGAEEAEQLAALLAGHDCYGPVHAEVSARPDWRLAASGGAASAQSRPFDGGVSVPAQAPPPGAEPSAERESWHATATADAGGIDGEAAGVQRHGADATSIDSAATGSYRSDQQQAEPPGAALPTAAAASPDALSPLPADPHDSPWPAGVQDGGDAGQSQSDPGRPYSDQRGPAERTGSIPPPAEFWQRGEPAGTVELAAVEQSSVIAFRRRSEQSADQWQELPAALAASDSLEAVPSQGAGYYGRRYQGFPPKYQPGPGLQDPPALFGAPTEDAGERSCAGLLGAVLSGAGEPADRPAGAGRPEAVESASGQPEDKPADADSPEAGKASVGQPAADEPSASEPSASEPSASEPSASEPGASEPSASVASARARSASRAKAGQSGVRQSTSGQSTAGGQSTTARSKSGQSRTGQSRTAQSGGPPKAGQARAAQSKPAQSRQASAASSAGRASGKEAGKRPRG